MDEVLEERDALLRERQELEVAKGEAEKALTAAKVDCMSLNVRNNISNLISVQ